MGYVAAAVVAAFLYFQHLIGGPLFLPLLPKGEAQPGVAIVSMSGDLGVDFGLTGKTARRFQADGIPVIAVNSHDFFKVRRTAAEASALLAQAIDKAAAAGHTQRVWLIGHSYGADMMHVALAGLPQAERDKIAAVALVVPGQTIFLKIDWLERYDWKPPEAAAVDTARLLTWVPVLCIQGSEEDASLCPSLTQPNVEHLTLPGGHLLHRDSKAVHDAVAAFFAKHRP